MILKIQIPPTEDTDAKVMQRYQNTHEYSQWAYFEIDAPESRLTVTLEKLTEEELKEATDFHWKFMSITCKAPNGARTRTVHVAVWPKKDSCGTSVAYFNTVAYLLNDQGQTIDRIDPLP